MRKIATFASGVALALVAAFAQPVMDAQAQEPPAPVVVMTDGSVSAEVRAQAPEVGGLSAASVDECVRQISHYGAIMYDRSVKVSVENIEACLMTDEVTVVATNLQSGARVQKVYTIDQLYPGRQQIAYWNDLKSGDSVAFSFTLHGVTVEATVIASELYPVFYSWDQEHCWMNWENDPWHLFELNGVQILLIETPGDTHATGSIDLSQYIKSAGTLVVKAYRHNDNGVLSGFKGGYQVQVKSCQPPVPEIGALTVIKTVKNESGKTLDPATQFTITVTGPENFVHMLSFGPEGGSQTLSNLTPGAYNVSEENPGGNWQVVNQTSNVEVKANETAVVEVTNTLARTLCENTIAQFGEWSGWAQDPVNPAVEFRTRQIVYVDAQDQTNVCGVDSERQERPYVPPSSNLYLAFGSKAPEPCRVLVVGMQDDPHYYWERFQPDWVPQMLVSPNFKGKTDWGTKERHDVWVRGDEKWSTEFSPIGDAEYISAVYHNDKLVVPTAKPLEPFFSQGDVNTWIVPVHGKIGHTEFNYYQFQISWSECSPATGKLADLAVFAAAAAQ